ncbi:MAG: thioredoxin domain-containing protein, partial [Proteobacteria bacterium]|nr:thioredoxin domain-containing protein [Pseudomonadota bacterium]
PVPWRAWNAETLALAQRENKPILLSIGYAACHWCHVMAHESFENEAIARVMNSLFINIKVDREERPDLDAIYQSALALMGTQGGWPLTMFLTPEREPFWGGTYFPATPNFGRPAFPDLLKTISETFHNQNEMVLKNVAAIREALTRLGRPAGGGGLSVELLDRAAGAAGRLVDPLHGGTSGAPKFPQPCFFRFLWRAYGRTGSTLFREAVTVTLDTMCQGGIYDHLGGGFSRYSTDERWLVPHFEKMLYDNALLVELLTEAWRDTHSPLYAVRVRETLDWALGEMRVVNEAADRAGGDAPVFAFASAFDADSEGVEGKYFVWTEDEIDAVLGDDSAPFKGAYDVTPGGNWEGRTILNRSRARRLGDAALEETLARCRARLLAARAARVPPQRDDKVLTDWNGLMIAALATAGAAFDEPAWLAAAEAAFSFVLANITEDGRLRHSWCAGRAAHPAVLDDYANMARAALALFEVTGDRAYLDRAEAWVAVADARYWDGDGGGYFLTADDTGDVITRTKTANDNAMPSGNGVMVEVLARLFYLTGKSAYRERAGELIAVFAGETPEMLLHMPTLLDGYELLEKAVQIVIVGAPEDSATRALVRAVFDSDPPNRVLTQLAPGTALPKGHPAHGKGQVDGLPSAYVCVGPTCGPPVTRPDALIQALSAL